MHLRHQRLLVLALTATALLGLPSSAHAGPRDASAVILHCGQATLGDTTIYENHTVAGGRRILKYFSGTINFDRVGNDGWTFTFGSHGKEEHLTAEQMDGYMPCLTVALADSAGPGPLRPVTAAERVETSMKRPYEKLIGGCLALLLALTILYLIFGRRAKEEDES